MDSTTYLVWLQQALFSEEVLTMDAHFPGEVFDSTGKLIAVAAVEQAYNIQLSVESLMHCTTPRQLFTIIQENTHDAMPHSS